MSTERVVYSIQKTYILNVVSTSEREIATCDQRIDIPTIEPLTEMKAVVYPDEFSKIIPCIELAGNFLSEFNLEFDTNEGVTVLPVKIAPGRDNLLENPYLTPRYVLVLPRGATGVKSCRLIHKATGNEVQHNFTFGIMPPPYNYDNALFDYLSFRATRNSEHLISLDNKVRSLKISTKTPTFEPIKIYKDAGKQTINIEDGVLFYDFGIIYPSSAEPTTYKPKITLNDGETDFDFTLSINKAMSGVSIDLFTGKITVYNLIEGDIFQQFMLSIPFEGFKTLSFDNFYDILTSYVQVFPRGACVK